MASRRAKVGPRELAWGLPAARKAEKTKPAAVKPKRKKKAPARKTPPRRPARLTVSEIDRRLELARKAAAKRKIDRSGKQQQLAAALEVAQMIAMDAGFPSTLKIAFPPRTHEGKWRAPWIVIGRYVFKKIGYAELWSILEKWTQRKLEKRINKDRLARMRINYVTERGKKEEYTLAETGPWSMVLARAMEQCDPADTETSYPGGRTGSLASRYPASRIESVFVWLSEAASTNVMDFAPP
jgi:hypothetical protein